MGPRLAGVLIASCWLAGAAPAEAQGALPLEQDAGAGWIEGAETFVAVAFEGVVNEPDGAPADGAVVVSSAGGQAVTDRRGGFRLEARVPVEAESVQITAVGGAGKNLVTSKRVSLSTAAGPIRVGSLRLAQDSSCSPSWIPRFGGQPGTNDEVVALVVFDDGSGPALHAGGWFTSAGGLLTNCIVKWDGSSWAALGSGTGGWVNALTVFDDGGGPALYAGGFFYEAGGVPAYHIAKWDGASWAALGFGLIYEVFALTVFDDGNGPALYAGGDFWGAGGVPMSYVAKWDGSSWSPLGNGVSDPVHALTVFDDGSGPALYAGGDFHYASTVSAKGVAKWDGASWSALGSGVTFCCGGGVRALTVFDDGGGPALYAGGDFFGAGGGTVSNIAKWDGSSWAALGGGVNDQVDALRAFDDGSGPVLYAGGDFTTAGGVAAIHVAGWDGSSWTPLGSGAYLGKGTAGGVGALAVFDDGGGPVLYVGGRFSRAGGIPGNNIAKWDGSSWEAFGGSGLADNIAALTVFDDGGGPALYAGASPVTAGGVVANGIAKWDGSSWAPLGSGTDSGVSVMAVFDDGGGPALFAGGSFWVAGGVTVKRIAKWDGSSWSPLGSGIDSPVSALTVFDDGGGPALYAGGGFKSAGGVAANYIAKWDGTAWSALGSGMDNSVNKLAVFDDGNGPALYAGGWFLSAGGSAANRIAKWDGSSWTTLGSGMSNKSYVVAMAVFDDGGGPALYAGGGFADAGGVTVNNIAKWDGSSWTALGSGTNGSVGALTVFDDGNGPALYAGGGFKTAGGVAAGRIARWNGSSWTALGSGMNNSVSALTVFSAHGPALYAGGNFGSAIDSGDSFLAEWGCPPPVGVYCTAGTSASGCKASISASGTASATSASGFDLIAMTVDGDKDGMFFFGSSGCQAVPWGKGTSFLCVVPPVKRTGLMTGVGTQGACNGFFSKDLNAHWTARPAHNPGAGAIVQAQLWYQDPYSTSNRITSFSNAIQFYVEP